MSNSLLSPYKDEQTFQVTLLEYKQIEKDPIPTYLTCNNHSRPLHQLPWSFKIHMDSLVHARVFDSLTIEAWIGNVLLPDHKWSRGELRWKDVKEQGEELYCGWLAMYTNHWTSKLSHFQKECKSGHDCPQEGKDVVAWVHVVISPTDHFIHHERRRSKSPMSLSSWILTQTTGETNMVLFNTISKLIGRLGTDYGSVLQKDWLSSLLALQRFHNQDKPFRVSRELSLQMRNQYPHLPHLPFQQNMDVNELELFKRYFRFAMASYGHLALSSFAGAGSYIVKTPDWQTLKSSIVGEEPQFIHNFLGVPTKDVVMMDFTPKSHPALLLVVDRFHQCLVLCVRGSFSSQDALTDLICEYVNYPYSKGHVHKGFLKSAETILEKYLEEIQNNLDKLGWNKLRIVGHSLGASVAALLAMLLVDQGSKIQVEAFCFAPAGTTTLELAMSRRYSMIRAVTCRWDWVSRSSWGALLDLMWCLSSIQTSFFGQDDFTDLKLTMDRLGLTHDFTTQCLSPQSVDEGMLNEKLYPVGTVYSLQPDGQDQTHTLLQSDEEAWILQHVPQVYLAIFVVHPRMFLDHLPSMYESRLAVCHWNAMKRVGLIVGDSGQEVGLEIELTEWKS